MKEEHDSSSSSSNPRSIIVFLVGILVIGAVIGAIFLRINIQNSSRGGGDNSNSATGKNSNGEEDANLKVDYFVPFIPKTVKVGIDYQVSTNTLKLRGVSMLAETIREDSRLAFNSDNNFIIFDKDRRVLLDERVVIHRAIAADSDDFQEPDVIPTTIYIPYMNGMDSIVFYDKGVEIINIPVSQIPVPTGTPKTEATGGSCPTVDVAIVSDNYSDMGLFRKHANRAIAALNSTAPFAGTGIFNYKIVENTDPMGCANGIDACLGSATFDSVLGKIHSQQGTKLAIVLTQSGVGNNRGLAFIGKGPAAVDTILAEQTSTIERVVVHEFLGHAVSYLYDRYVSSSGNGIRSNVRSNCSDNSNGESWWSGAGGQGAYQGCSNPNLYAPFPLTCGDGGNPATVMGQCGSTSNPQFDSVEEAYVSSKVLPSLSCQGNGSLPPSGGSNPNPTTPPTNNGLSIATLPPNCSDSNYTALLQWQGSGQGWYVDITSASNFTTGFSNRDVSGLDHVVAPDKFSNNLTLQPGKTYKWRLYNGTDKSYAYGRDFSLPKCTNPNPTSPPGGPNPTSHPFTPAPTGGVVDCPKDCPGTPCCKTCQFSSGSKNISGYACTNGKTFTCIESCPGTGIPGNTNCANPGWATCL